MKLFNKIIILVFLLSSSSSLALFLYYRLSPHHPQPLFPVSAASVLIPESHAFHFFNEGFAISEQQAWFFSHDGRQLEPPLAIDDLVSAPSLLTIDKSTANYMLFNGRYIYNTSTIPFQKTWESNMHDIWDIQEFDRFLLVILNIPNVGLQPYILDPQESSAVQLDGLAGSFYLDASHAATSHSFSVLTLTDKTPQPSTMVFHYTTEGAHYGALAVTNWLAYKIYRLQNQVLLVGAYRVMCYNIDGTVKWELDAPNAHRHQAVFSGTNLWLYFTDPAFGSYNALRIAPDGEKTRIELPGGMSSLQPYTHGFLGVEKHQDVLVFDDMGNITARYRPGVAIDSVFWTSSTPQNIYVVDLHRRIHIYTTEKPVDRKDENQ